MGKELVHVERPAWQPGDPGVPGGTVSPIWTGWDPEDHTWAEDSPVGRILAAVSRGATTTAAVASAGISRGTWYAWLARSREYGLRSDGTFVEPGEVSPRVAPWVALPQRLHEAQSILEVELVDIWRAHAVADWRAAEKLLARRFPDRWGDRRAELAEQAEQNRPGELTARQLDELAEELAQAGIEV